MGEGIRFLFKDASDQNLLGIDVDCDDHFVMKH